MKEVKPGRAGPQPVRARRGDVQTGPVGAWRAGSRPGRRLNNELLLFPDLYNNKAFRGISLLARGENLQIQHEEKYKSDI